MLDQSRSLDDLRIPPANHLEKLRFGLTGYHSIRVNRQFRLVFIWTERGAEDVHFIGYH
jgi:proteic killer suppression protein